MEYIPAKASCFAHSIVEYFYSELLQFVVPVFREFFKHLLLSPKRLFIFGIDCFQRHQEVIFR